MDDTLRVLTQIRDVLTTSPEARGEHFRSDRIARIRAGDIPRPLGDHPKTVLHLVPHRLLGSSAGSEGRGQRLGSLRPLTGLGVTQRPNLDGVVAWNDGSYAQLYRSGILEAADSTFLDEGHLPSTAFTDGMVERLQEYLGLLRRIPVDPPVTLLLSLLGVSGCWIAIRGRSAEDARFGVHDLLCPPYAINDLSAEPFDILLPSLDVIANAAGLVTWPRPR